MKINQLLKLIGLIIFIFILTKIDFQKIKEIIPAIQVSYLFMAVIFTLLPVAVKAYRWEYLLKMQQIDYSFKDSFMAYLCSVFAGIITPAKAGELIKVFYVKKATNISLGKAFSSVIIDRILDLFFLLLFALTGILYFYVYYDYLIVLITLLVMLVITILFLLNKQVKTLLVNLLLKLVTIRFKNKLTNHVEDFLNGLDIVGRIKFIFPVFLTLVSYLIYFFNCYLISKSLSMPISFSYLSFSISITVVLALLPVTIAGIGIRDASLIFLFWQIGIDKEMALTYSLLFLVFINITAGLVGIFAWMKMPFEFYSTFSKPIEEVKQNEENAAKFNKDGIGY